MTPTNRGKLFEYAVIYHPKQTKDQHDRGEMPQSELVIAPTRVMAGAADQVAIMAARAIPEEHVHHLDDLETVVRPF